MSEKPERKPRKVRRVVLGRGELHHNADEGSVRVMYHSREIWMAVPYVLYKAAAHEGERGTLIWEPDPPKAKRGGE